MPSTYDQASGTAQEVESQANMLAKLARDLYWSTLEPSHNEGCDVNEESGAAQLELIKDRLDTLNDWVRALEESVNEHKAFLAEQENEGATQ